MSQGDFFHIQFSLQKLSIRSTILLFFHAFTLTDGFSVITVQILSLHVIDRLEFMTSKYDGTHMLFMRFNTSIFPFLPASCPSSHLSIQEVKSLSREHPQKPSSTTTTTVKHLAVERPVFVFNKCDKSNGATLFPANKSNQYFGLVHSDGLCFGKSLPTMTHLYPLKLKNMPPKKSYIALSACQTVWRNRDHKRSVT